MRPRQRTLAVLVTAVLLAPAAVPRVAAAAPAAPAPPTTVTLVTGDRVTVVDGRASVRPGPGRDGVGFLTTRVGGHLRVVPTDVLPLLAAGTVDDRLFDVTTLLAFRYDDRRADVPLIVTGPAASASTARSARAVPGGRALRLPKNDIGSAWAGLAAGVRAEGAARAGHASKIWLDGVRRLSLTRSVPQIGAPAAWAAGYDGTGVRVAVLDSGVDAGHPDLAGRVVTARDFTEGGDTVDRNGHGTHVAATIASTGAAPGGYRGVAPGAALLAGKVCDSDGYCPDSAVLAGMQWAAESGARVVTMSLGGTDTPEQDPLEAAVERLTAEFGTLFVVAAGNSGRDESIESPGSAGSALTVGAVDRSDALAAFSSRGPRIGDAALKPDVTAPGVDITAALSRDAGGPPDMTHIALSGTSMATPHAAGAAALLAQQHPGWRAGDLKAALMGSAEPAPGTAPYAQGAGRVDVARAITATVTADPAGVSFGVQSHPHADDVPDARAVTYRNSGPADVTLALALSGDAPAGLFSLSAAALTVPAGGTAAVTLTSDTRAAVPDARYGGFVVATAGGTRVVTPFAVDKETERHELTITQLDRAGRPTDGFVLLVDVAGGPPVPVATRGTTVVRLPEATYVALGSVVEGEEISIVADATVTLDRPTTITLDSRDGKPVSMAPPAADAAAVLSDVTLVVNLPDRLVVQFGAFLPRSFEGIVVGQSDPAERQPRLTTALTAHWITGPVDYTRPWPVSPYAYFLTEFVTDHVPAGFAKRYSHSDLGRLDATYAGQGPTTGFTTAYATLDGREVVTPSSFLPVTLPGRRTEYYTVANRSWGRYLYEGDDFGSAGVQQSAPVRFQAGRTTSERINPAVFGPALGGDSFVGWYGQQLQVLPGLHASAGALAGSSPGATGRVVVERAGTVVHDRPAPVAVVTGLPAAPAPYRVTVEHDRGAPSRLSTHVSVEWTFRSGAPTGTGPTPLPLSTVRFAPPLTDTGTAPAGKLWVVPVTVGRQPGSAAAPAATLTVEVSYDDGRTWHAVPVLRWGQHGVLALRHPATAGFVSLRAASTDTAGNTVRQTVVRAYEIV